MKTLLILRHAKSSWNHATLNDYDRPLNDRGLKTAPLMGKLLLEKTIAPDAIFSSPAMRAITTAQLIAKSIGHKHVILTVEQFYPGTPGDYIEILSSKGKNYSTIMVVGHNPGLEDLLKILTGQSEHLPTGALSQIELPIFNWSELTAKIKGSLIKVFRPKEIFKELIE